MVDLVIRLSGMRGQLDLVGELTSLTKNLATDEEYGGIQHVLCRLEARVNQLTEHFDLLLTDLEKEEEEEETSDDDDLLVNSTDEDFEDDDDDEEGPR